MPSVKHTMTGSVNPAAVPPSLGAHYHNTASRQRWIAQGTASPADWGRPLPAAPLLVASTVDRLSVKVDQPPMHWKVDSTLANTLVFEEYPVSGFYKVELILESADRMDAVVYVETDLGDSRFKIDRQFTILGGTATYYAFGCWIDLEGAPIWTLLEESPLAGRRPAVTDIPDTAPSFILQADNPMTYWNLVTVRSRSMALPNLQGGYPVELSLVLDNRTGSEVTVEIDTTFGLPLKDHDNLVVPPLSAILYKLLYFPAAQGLRWQVIQTIPR